MKRTYNIGTECYAIITSANDAEFLLPVKIILLEKYTQKDRTLYKVKIREIFESNFDYLKEHIGKLYVQTTLSKGTTTIIKKGVLDKIAGFAELLKYLNDKPFYLEDNYITLDKNGLKDLYCRFVKYIINFHFRKLYQLMNRSFLINTPMYIDNKDVFKKRINNMGFSDLLRNANINLDF